MDIGANHYLHDQSCVDPSVYQANEMSQPELNSHQRRFADYNSLLVQVSRQSLPWVCYEPTTIEKLLALKSADLIAAEFDSPIQVADGSKHIARATVTAMTADGRATALRLEKEGVQELTKPGWTRSRRSCVESPST